MYEAEESKRTDSLQQEDDKLSLFDVMAEKQESMLLQPIE